jgi:hypothetical protein
MHCAYVVLLLLLTLPATAQVTDITLTDGNICRGGTIDLGTLIVETPAHVPYSRWKEGNNYLNSSGFSCPVSPTTTTTYTLEYRLSATGDLLTKDAQVKVWLEPNVVAPADTTVCRGQSVQLLADATNAQEIIWRYGSTTYSNGAVYSPIESKTYTFVVTARNDYCSTSSSDAFLVEGIAPINRADVRADIQSQQFCKGATINLLSLLNFFVIDDENVSYPATYLSDTSTWTSNGAPVPDPTNYKVPDWAALAATVTASLSYTSVCDGAKTYTVNKPVILYITGIPTTVNAFGNYRNCPGDPVDIQIYLSSACADTIKYVNISNAVCNRTSYTPREQTYRCNPISTGASYTVYVETTAIDTTMSVTPLPVDPPTVNWFGDLCKGDSADFCITTDCHNITNVEWTVMPASVAEPQWRSSASHSWCFRLTATENATYTAKIKYDRAGKTTNVDTAIFISLPLIIHPSYFNMWTSPSEICKGDTADLVVTSDCDSIVDIDNWNITPPPMLIGRSKKMMAYRVTVNENKSIQARLTYYDKLAKSNATTTISTTLNVRNYPPDVSPTSYNICRGSAGTALIIADICDTIKNVVWKNKETGATLTPQPLRNPDFPPSQNAWQYILSPNDSITYIAEIEYMRSMETTVQKVSRDVFISVRERPHILKNDTVPVCETVSTINLNHYIDSALVNVGSVQWFGYYSNPPVVPNSNDAPVKTYQVQAEYAYMCSEMTTLQGEDEHLTVIFQTSNKPAFAAPTPNATYCQNYIPLQAVEQFTTYKWRLPGGVEINEPDTVYTAATTTGAFNLILTAENTCGINSTTATIFLSAIPYVTVAQPVIEACVGSTVILALSDYEHTGMISWNDPAIGDIEPVITVTAPATYIVSVTNIPCPTALDTIVINAIPLAQVEAMDDVNKCENEELILSVKNWFGNNLDWVQVTDNNTFIPVNNTTFPVTTPGTYIAIASNQCNKDSSTVHITMTALPFATVRPDTTACLGDTITLVTESLNGTQAWYTDGRQVDPKITVVATPTLYTVVASNECGNSEPGSITVFARPPITIKPAEMPSFKHRIYYDIRFTAENAVHPVSYNINGALPAGLTFKSDGSIVGFPILSGNNYHDYPLTITAKDAGNCNATCDYILLPTWSAPNAFIPGSSGFNSVFLSEYQLEIYDRRGRLIHEGFGWSGIEQNGRRAPAGTYYYIVTIPQTNNNAARYFSGYITVLPQ